MSTSPIADALRARLDQFLVEHPEAPGISLLVHTPSTYWKGAAGFSDPTTQTALRPDDSIYIASVAKPMTAAIALRLAEEGALSLDQTLPAYLSTELLHGLHRLDGTSYDDQITVRHLLSHASGLPDTFGSPGFMDLISADPDRLWKPVETIQFVKERCTPLFPPGAGFNYSDANYTLVGLVIESVTGASLDDAYRRHIYRPLGLQTTYRRFLEPPQSARAAHVFYGDTDFTDWRALTADWAGGGLDSTLEDLDRFLRALSHGEVFREPATREEMFRWRPWSGNAQYGLGIMRIDLDHDSDPSLHGMREVWGHMGASSCFMFHWPLADATFCGTFNQVACEHAVIPFVAELVRVLSAYMHSDASS